MQPIGDARNYKPSAVSGFEPAGSIAESAFLRINHDGFACQRVERRKVYNGLADLLAVSPDVLDRRRADRAWNSRQAFDPGKVIRHGEFNDIIPLFPRSGSHQ